MSSYSKISQSFQVLLLSFAGEIIATIIVIPPAPPLVLRTLINAEGFEGSGLITCPEAISSSSFDQFVRWFHTQLSGISGIQNSLCTYPFVRGAWRLQMGQPPCASSPVSCTPSIYQDRRGFLFPSTTGWELSMAAQWKNPYNSPCLLLVSQGTLLRCLISNVRHVITGFFFMVWCFQLFLRYGEPL